MPWMWPSSSPTVAYAMVPTISPVELTTTNKVTAARRWGKVSGVSTVSSNASAV